MAARIQAYLRVAAARDRDVERVGPFLATFSRVSDNPYRNHAIPDSGAEPSAGDVAALAAAYRRRGRRPRLEYLAACAPAAEAALLAGGFAVEERLPLMIAEGAAPDVPAPAGFTLEAPLTPADVGDLVAVQHEAYGDPPPSAAEVEGARAAAAAGCVAVLARVAETREAVGGGMSSAPAGGVVELAGVGVRAPFRRRGLAAAITARMLREALARGCDLPLLMAAGAAEARIYARVGFRTVGEVLQVGG